jgi:hypothetical protein
MAIDGYLTITSKIATQGHVRVIGRGLQTTEVSSWGDPPARHRSVLHATLLISMLRIHNTISSRYM